VIDAVVAVKEKGLLKAAGEGPAFQSKLEALEKAAGGGEEAGATKDELDKWLRGVLETAEAELSKCEPAAHPRLIEQRKALIKAIGDGGK
jgi:hypothetical protein